jgi:hypothetical protein
MIKDLVRLKINGIGEVYPKVENFSFVVITGDSNRIDFGMIYSDPKNSYVEIFNINNLSFLNRTLFQELITEVKSIDDNKQTVFLVKENLVKRIFGELVFNSIDSKKNNYHEKILLIESGMLLYGIIANNVFQECKNLKNYSYIKAFLYNLIEIYREDLLENDFQEFFILPYNIKRVIEEMGNVVK